MLFLVGPHTNKCFVYGIFRYFCGEQSKIGCCRAENQHLKKKFLPSMRQSDPRQLSLFILCLLTTATMQWQSSIENSINFLELALYECQPGQNQAKAIQIKTEITVLLVSVATCRGKAEVVCRQAIVLNKSAQNKVRNPSDFFAISSWSHDKLSSHVLCECRHS